MIIGITGGVGAGKTAVLTYLKENYNACLLVADDIAKDLLQPRKEAGRKIRKLFPAGLFEPDGTVKRAQMADYIFHHPEMRTKQNDIVFPMVKKVIRQKINENREKEFIVVEAALLIEEHYDEICDVMWYIYSSEQKRTRRLMESRGYSRERICAMMSSQLTEEEFREGCDEVICNDGTLEETYARIDELLEKYRQR